jgi:hypothetical protein
MVFRRNQGVNSFGCCTSITLLHYIFVQVVLNLCDFATFRT